MAAKRITPLVIAALVCSTLLLFGCEQPTPNTKSSKKRTTTSTTTTSHPPKKVASVESTSTSKPSKTTTSTVAGATGAITRPGSGSALRKALLDAARKKLSTSSGFYIHQLYAQGNTALGDLEALNDAKIGRVFIAWEKQGGTWKAISATKSGTDAAKTARATPAFSAALVKKINWATVVSKVANASASSMSSSLSSAAKSWASSSMGGAGKPYKLTVLKVAKDGSGVWWGRAVVQPTGDANNSYDPLTVWARNSTGTWTGKVQDPEPPAPSSYFPATVTSKLGL